jgi:hypothetical protein
MAGNLIPFTPSTILALESLYKMESHEKPRLILSLKQGKKFGSKYTDHINEKLPLES